MDYSFFDIFPSKRFLGQKLSIQNAIELRPSSAVEIYSVSDDVWTRGPDMPGTIAGTRAIQLEDTFQGSLKATE